MRINKSRKIAICFAFILGYTSSSIGSVLTVDDPTPRAGFFVLSWKPSAANSVVLQQSKQATFDGVRQWPVDGVRAFTMSGLNDGVYFYRLVNNQGNALSGIVKVEVKHHSLVRAWILFVVGALLFSFLIRYIYFNRRLAAIDSD